MHATIVDVAVLAAAVAAAFASAAAAVAVAVAWQMLDIHFCDQKSCHMHSGCLVH